MQFLGDPSPRKKGTFDNRSQAQRQSIGPRVFSQTSNFKYSPVVRVGSYVTCDHKAPPITLSPACMHARCSPWHLAFASVPRSYRLEWAKAKTNRKFFLTSPGSAIGSMGGTSTTGRRARLLSRRLPRTSRTRECPYGVLEICSKPPTWHRRPLLLDSLKAC